MRRFNIQKVEHLLRSTFSVVLSVLALLTLSESIGHAQSIVPTNINIVNTPSPGHDYIMSPNETVNPANGSLSFRLEAPTPRQRGDVNFPFYVFGYDSGGVVEPAAWISRGVVNDTVQSSLNIYWLDSSHVTGGGYVDAAGLIPGGFVANAGIGGTFFQQTSVNVTISEAPLVYATCSFDSGYVYIDPFATRHSMNVGWITQSGSGDGDDGCAGAQIGGGFNQTWGDSNYAITLQGTQFTPSVNSFVTDLHGRSGWGEDTNGNCCGPTATKTISNGEIASASIPGLANPYVFTYTTATRTYNPAVSLESGACPGTWTPEPSSSTALQNITLPNSTQSNPQKYTFGYDGNYGLMNRITYPTGAYVSYTWGDNPSSEFIQLGGGIILRRSATTNIAGPQFRREL